MKKTLLVVFGWLLTISSLQADVRLNSLFSDCAVLQQGMKVPVWGTAGEGEKVSVEFAGQQVSTTATNGKWRVELSPLKATSQASNLAVTGKNKVVITNVVVGEVWLCSGQSNMERKLGLMIRQKPIDNWEEEVAMANYPSIRQFTVPVKSEEEPRADAKGHWLVCSPQTAADFTAVGYFFARELQRKLNVPIGLLFSARGGSTAESWVSRSALETDAEFDILVKRFETQVANYPTKLSAWKEEEQSVMDKWKNGAEEPNRSGSPAPRKPSAPLSPVLNRESPMVSYNGMLAPLIPYAIRGVAWYQGESNSTRGKQYRRLLPALIADWRQSWGQGNFLFLIVQIAPYDDHDPRTDMNDPEVREAQLLTAKTVSNTALIVTIDVGEVDDIHPPHKEKVGARLALSAWALAYGEKLEYSGPIFESVALKENAAVVTFTHVGGGLMAQGGELKGFTIAGADKRFVMATARIRGGQVVVSSHQIARPVAVRYAWAKAPDGNLFNQEGLPASPFRTDTDGLEVDR